MLTACALPVVWLIGYAALCAAQPFTRCRTCAGTGETEHFRIARTCPRCHGDRYRLRRGRRLHNAWRRTYEAGTRPPRKNS
ncbi:hypothetical protein ACFY1J_31010 [Streptomyces sp. NPDC001406]|uniref:hypothetical protein n=1 Tax=Streptomyces sp. NPDC001406 TaxID=3364572 RepID=UPI0036CCFE7A